ncbi:MAG: DoxX family membrane protein [Micrococcales bacterium]|nr:DoxX family membrane protein [Micrococcales bacterium]
MSFLRFAGRAMLGGALVADGVDALRHPEDHAEAIQPWVAKAAESIPIPDDPVQVSKAAAGGLIAGGAMIATGVMSRLGACLSSSILSAATALGHPFWKEGDPDTRRQERKGFLMHLAMLGGAVLVLSTKKTKPGSKCCKGKSVKAPCHKGPKSK